MGFGSGSKVFLKAGSVPAVIIRPAGDSFADKGTWLVRVIDQNGQQGGELLSKTTQQLRNPKKGEAFPTAPKRAPDPAAEHPPRPKTPAKKVASKIKKAITKVASPIIGSARPRRQTRRPEKLKEGAGDSPTTTTRQSSRSKGQKKVATPTVVNLPDSLSDDDDSDGSQGGDSSDFEGGNDDKEHEETSQGTTDSCSLKAASNKTDDSDSSDSEDDHRSNPDEDEAEDIPRYYKEEEGEDFIDPHDMAQSLGIETDDKKYAKKWRLYQAEKAKLLDKKFSVKVGPPKTQKIAVGETVMEKGGEKRHGLVVADDRTLDDNGNKGKPMWSVLFDGDESPTRKVRSTKLKLVRDQREFKWTIVKDSLPDDPVEPFEFNGLTGFDMTLFNAEMEHDARDETYDFPFLQLLKVLWPGDWRAQLMKLNHHIATINDGRRDKKRHIKPVTEKMWWVVWGVIFAACPCGKAGKSLFDSTPHHSTRMAAPPINVGVDKKSFDSATGKYTKQLISWTRFKEIKEIIHHAFDSGQSDTEDPWHPISKLVDDYNANRRQNIASGSTLVDDESMSNFQPRTTKTSLLPVLAFVFRKPKPLGVEYKVAADSETGVNLFLEIQRGKEPMRKKKFFECGGTAACTLRLLVGSVYSGKKNSSRVEAQRSKKRYLVTADAWFGSVRLAEAMKCLYQRDEVDEDGNPVFELDKAAGNNPDGHEVIAAVKTNSSWFPKEELQKVMKPWPSGAYLAMKCKTPGTNVELVAIGYKYNARKVLLFISTKNAGSTMPSVHSYIAKFNDKRGNVCQRKVPRPDVVSTLFWRSNAIDSHNQARQHLLGLERLWKTPNPWARNVFTIIGMTAIDAWKCLRYHHPHFETMSVADFANRLAYDCMYYPHKDVFEPTNQYIPRNIRNDPEALFGSTASVQSRGASTQESTDSRAIGRLEAMMQHLMVATGSVLDSPSPLTTCSPAFTFKNSNKAGHDPMPQRTKEVNGDGRGTKRRCVICKENTRTECDSIICRNKSKTRGQVVYVGVPICDPRQVGVRKNLRNYGMEENERTCIQIHRDEFEGR